MNLKLKLLFTIIYLIFFSSCNVSKSPDTNTNKKVSYGKEIVVNTLENLNQKDNVKINTTLDKMLSDNREAYKIKISHDTINITGGGEAGILYGCLKAKQILMRTKTLPQEYFISDAPTMKWRGISLQLMKLGEYNYAITPQEFPFFYDKSLWEKFLNFMLEQRFNYIVLWNGFPFDYFVKDSKFKEAQTGMSTRQIQQNHDMLRWLISEAGKRNIKIFFEFYNINTSVFFQKAHHLPGQLAKPTPLLEDYVRHSIALFVKNFPEAGLFVTPGEGLDKEYSDDWINHVIFKAIKSTGFTPTVFMRAWFFDIPHAKKIINNYPDLYFVHKYNVEMIADTLPDPDIRSWAKLNNNLIVNIHLAANLEPFRWNPPSYIRKIVKNSIKDGANGIHIHPRKAWRWPYGSDTGKKEFQWQRDTLFFTAWSRYAWNPYRDKSIDQKFWMNLLTKRYGNEKAAQGFLNSFEAGADVLPGLQRLIWLGYDNHTIVTAGATLLQLQNSKGIPFLSLKPTLRISEYIEALKTGKKIVGETPIIFTERKMKEAEVSLKEAKIAAKNTVYHHDEAKRIVSDAQAVFLASEYYYHKLQALKAWVLMEEKIQPVKNRQLFIHFLTASVQDFKELCQVTEKTYTSVSDVPARHPVRLKKIPYHWKDLLSVYENELNIYKKEVTGTHSADYDKPTFNGLAGKFYSEPGFIDAEEPFPAKEVNFDWYGNEEIGRHWSVKWFGYLKAPVSDSVHIILSADRKVQIKIRDESIIFNTSRDSTKSKKFLFKKDQVYPLEIYYDHSGGEGGFIKLKWSWDGKPEEIIPDKYLFHSGEQKDKMNLLVKLINQLQ